MVMASGAQSGWSFPLVRFVRTQQQPQRRQYPAWVRAVHRHPQPVGGFFAAHGLDAMGAVFDGGHVERRLVGHGVGGRRPALGETQLAPASRTATGRRPRATVRRYYTGTEAGSASLP